MNWPKEIENNKNYDNVKAIYSLILSDSWFSKCEVMVCRSNSWNAKIKDEWTLNYLKVIVNSDDNHYFYYRSSNFFSYNFNKITKNGNSVRNHTEVFFIDDPEKAVKNEGINHY